MTKAIESAIETDDWPRARVLIRSALKRDPDSHWLLTRLGLTYYEQRQYKRAIQYSEKALALAPHCPLVLWDYAGCLEMLDRTQEALAIYRRLLRRGINRLAHLPQL
jgi:tetratricopeptide (TPR) repeat protein